MSQKRSTSRRMKNSVIIRTDAMDKSMPAYCVLPSFTVSRTPLQKHRQSQANSSHVAPSPLCALLLNIAVEVTLDTLCVYYTGLLHPHLYLDPTTFPKEWGSPPDRAVAMNDAQFSVLYSDVGPDFYAACGPTPDEEGWAVRGVGNTVVWDVDSNQSTVLHLGRGNGYPSTLYTTSFQDDDFIINSNTPKRKLKTTKLQVSFSFLPSRIEAYQRDGQKGFTEKENPPTERWGISYSTDNDILAFASWFFELKSSSPRALNITRLRFPSDADEDKANSFTETQRSQILEDIFTRIFTVAKEHRIEKVEIWDVPEEILSLGILQGWGGQVVEREKHLSAFKWYGEERNEDVEWMNNERFAWC
ncbi:hypothetical protein D9758_007932 [Tetrapyrgos nigripes]|uniref:LYC1 C-terminal domain-containing protein n=1 Tax=Tetrapyrgos nigripes TaxID=182062 RepID=A0A8H5D3R5_9AGAR|nr:hypothetical protein D9758_007932 [Tetrapyrgos nigripes]